MSAGRNEKVVPGNFCGRRVRSSLDVARGRRVALLERDQRIAVLGADGASVLVGHVDAAERQADVVDDVVDLRRRDDAAHRLLDELEEARGLLDARAGLGAHVHQDLPGVDRREEILPEKRHEREGQQHAGEKADQECPGWASASDSSAR